MYLTYVAWQSRIHIYVIKVKMRTDALSHPPPLSSRLFSLSEYHPLQQLQFPCPHPLLTFSKSIPSHFSFLGLASFLSRVTGQLQFSPSNDTQPSARLPRQTRALPSRAVNHPLRPPKRQGVSRWPRAPSYLDLVIPSYRESRGRYSMSPHAPTTAELLRNSTNIFNPRRTWKVAHNMRGR